MSRLWSYMRRYRGRYVFGLACLLVTGTMAMAVPYLLKRAVDAIAAGRPPSVAATVALAAMSARVQENLSGMHVVKSYVREPEETEEFARLNADFSAQNMELARVRGVIMPVMRGASTLGTLVVLWYGGLRVIAGALSLGDLVAFIGYLHLLAWPTMALGWMLSIVQRGRAALQRLEEIFAIEPAIDDRAAVGNGVALHGEIAFHHVDFAYETAGNGH